MRNPRSRRWNLAWTMLIVLATLAPAAYAAITCHENVNIYWEDGKTQYCSTFCTWRGGWSCQ